MLVIRRPTNQKGKNTDLVNDKIPNVDLLVIDETGENQGVMSRDDALEMAYDRGLDLFVVSDKAKPMVAKFIDYSKYRFDQQKKLKEIKKNQQVVNLKELRLSPTIQDHDLNTKLRHAKRFIKNGDKVKLSMRFYGRMMAHQDIGREVMDRFIEALGDSIEIESKPKMEGRNLIAILAPNSNK